KGADKAIAVMHALHDLGLPARLRIIGCAPPLPLADPWVEVTPTIDKFAPGGMHAFAQIYADTDYLVLPTRMECFGVVFAEASAFGVPSITHATGGVPSAVHEGVNGHLFAVDSPPREMAEAIARNWLDDGARVALRRSSKRHYEEHLSWSVVGRR